MFSLNPLTPEESSVPETTENDKSVEQVIFDLLMDGIGNETSVCAIMGNLKQESNLCPYRYESDYSLNYEYSLKTYEYYINSRQDFVYSAFAFGLAQWTGPNNLARLWDYCEENNLEPCSVEAQIEFICYDLENNCPRLWSRLKVYEPKHIVTATEDFRQSYEKSIQDFNSQYMRAQSAKYYYLLFASKSEADVMAVADAYYDFQIEHQIKRIELYLVRQDDEGK